MISRFSYIILLLFIAVKFYSQDIIVKKDSTKLISKLLEINPQKIKYSRFDNLKGPIYVISKNDVAYIIYSNGMKESFHNNPELPANNSYLNKKDSLVKTLRVKDYIKFNVQIGAIVNNNYSNVQRKQPTPSRTTSESYSAHNGNLYNYNINLGFNFLFGRSKCVKHILGVNYLHSRGEYEYNYGQGGYTSYQKDLKYISHVDYLNFVTGIQFSIGRHIKIEPQISLNAAINVSEKINGTSKTTTVSGGPTPYVLDYEVKIYKDEKVNSGNTSSTFSFNPKISYEFKIKQNIFGVYLSYNLAYKYRLPWYMAGITYYPFKKLR